MCCTVCVYPEWLCSLLTEIKLFTLRWKAAACLITFTDIVNMCVSVCICMLPVLCESVCVPACLAWCVFSRASSLELKNAPNANLSRNCTNRNKNANVFNPHNLSSLYFSFHRWMAAASFICPVKVLPGGRDEKREKWAKSRQWAGDSQEKRDVGDVQLRLFFFFSRHRLVRKSGRGIIQR